MCRGADQSSSGRCIIFSGFWQGSPPTPPLEISHVDYKACADGGYLICAAMGFEADIVIGDFDSLSADKILEIESLGIEKAVFPCEKDDTDVMLCAKHGLALGFDNFLILGGIGGDFAHTIANLQTLSFLIDMGCKAEILTSTEQILMLDGRAAGFSGCAGAKFSVFSYVERSSGVYIENAKYPLSDVVLTNSSPIGAGNEFINTEPVTISVRQGRLLVIVELQRVLH